MCLHKTITLSFCEKLIHIIECQKRNEREKVREKYTQKLCISITTICIRVISLALLNILPKNWASNIIRKWYEDYIDLLPLIWLSSSHFFVSSWCVHNKRLQAMNDDGMLKLTFQRVYWNTDLSFACVYESECTTHRNNMHTK